MMPFPRVRTSATAALHCVLLAGFALTCGCSGSASGNKADDPALKSATQKSMELYKSKTQHMKPRSQSAVKRPR